MANPSTETVKVKALTPVSVAGTFHESGATFAAPLEAVRDALARGLLERVESKATQSKATQAKAKSKSK